MESEEKIKNDKDKKTQHIMFSYSWTQKNQVRHIYDIIDNEYSEVPKWIDINQMSGNIIEAMGDAVSPLRNGLVTNQKVMGFSLYKSNALNQSADITDDDLVSLSGVASGENVVLAGHMSAVATASSIAKTEVVRDPDSFADIIRGLHVFGRKVLRPEGLVLGIIDYS